MFSTWWFLWVAFMFFFIASPVGYGWGYRGWGPPYPRYLQRRRAVTNAGRSPSFNHHSWGWGGDLVWLMVGLSVFWVGMALWWR